MDEIQYKIYIDDVIRVLKGLIEAWKEETGL